MSYPVRSMLMFMLCLPNWSYAEEAEKEDIPTIELLEFLGEWQTDSGEWLDPNEVIDDGFLKMLEVTEDEENENESS